MQVKKLTLLIICFVFFGIPNYSFSDQADIDDINIKTVESGVSDQEATDNTATEAPAPGTNDQIGNMLLQSLALIGIPYKWGGNTPTSGLDCSGFIRYIFKKSLGITLPRTANEMAYLGRKIPVNQLEPGDLMFFNMTGGGRISHVGMYLGQGKFIQSPRTGKDIEVSDFNKYYLSKFVVAKRMVQENVNDDNTKVLADIRDERDTFIAKRSKIKPLKATKKHHHKKRYR
jgi:cell wall-associated NlpC family hydrolase